MRLVKTYTTEYKGITWTGEQHEHVDWLGFIRNWCQVSKINIDGRKIIYPFLAPIRAGNSVSYYAGEDTSPLPDEVFLTEIKKIVDKYT